MTHLWILPTGSRYYYYYYYYYYDYYYYYYYYHDDYDGIRSYRGSG